MPPQSFFLDLWKIWFQQGAQLQRRQLELLTAMQFRLAESQARQVMDFWSTLWRSAASRR